MYKEHSPETLVELWICSFCGPFPGLGGWEQSYIIYVMDESSTSCTIKSLKAIHKVEMVGKLISFTAIQTLVGDIATTLKNLSWSIGMMIPKSYGKRIQSCSSHHQPEGIIIPMFTITHHHYHTLPSYYQMVYHH